MRIKIGDDILDEFREEIIAQNYEVNKIGDITTRQGGFSNEFILPLTSKNRVILGIPDDINSITRKPYEKVLCSLIDQGTTVADGYLRYQDIKDKQIQVSFFSDNVEWFTLIKDKSLKDLDLSDFDHDWNVTEITNAISADKSSGFTYPLIDYGEFSALTSLAVNSDQMFPAMFMSTIVNQIFFDIGWKTEGEMIDHPLFKRMIIPFSDKGLSHTSDFIDDNAISFNKDGDQSASDLGTVLTWLPGGAVSLNVATNGNYTITLDLSVGLLSIPPANSYDVFFNILFGPTIKSFLGLTSFLQTITLIAEDVDLLTTDDIQIVIFTDVNTQTFLADTTIDFDLNAPIHAGSEIQISEIMPDIKQSDLLNYLAFVFGGVPQANNFSKTVNFGLFKSIKNNIPNAIDWSNKVDRSKRSSIDFTELLNKYSSVSVLKYLDDDNDSELTTYESENAKSFGEGQFDITNEHVTGKKVIFTAPFSGMININSFDSTMYIPQIAFKVAGSNDLKIVPKVAILSKNISVDTLSFGQHANLDVTDIIDSSVVSESNIPFCWFAKEKYLTEVDALLDTLAFDQVVLPNAIGDPIIDRFLIDYEQILNTIKFIEEFFHLTESDINELDFLIPIFIDRHKSYFYISKIANYEGSLKTTKAELVKIADG